MRFGKLAQIFDVTTHNKKLAAEITSKCDISNYSLTQCKD